MGRRRKWKVDLLSGQAAALILLSASFLAGCVGGCVAVGLIRESAEPLFDCLSRSVAFLSAEGSGARFLSVLWAQIRFPAAVALLALTALGVAGVPVLFALRGFLLCYAVGVFYRLLGLAGLGIAFVLFGISALLWMPAMVQLGVRGLVCSYGMLRRTMGDGRYPLRCGSRFLLCCGGCAIALLGCAALECLAVPKLLLRLTGTLLSG